MRRLHVIIGIAVVIGIIALMSTAALVGLGSKAAASGSSHRGRPITRAVSLAPVAPADPLAIVHAGTPAGVPSGVVASEPPRAVGSPVNPLHVLLMGDSLAWEARDDFTQAITGSGKAAVDSLVFGGTAICDWLGSLDEELAKFRPQVALVEFSGNSLTPCMNDPATGAPYVAPSSGWLEKYRSDANAAMEIFTRYGVTVYWAAAPITRASSARPLDAVYTLLPAMWPNARYVDAGAAVLDKGKYTDYLPCLPVDPCTDTDPQTGQRMSPVRSPDGTHFCPGAPAARRGVTSLCAVWSSGAWRFANAMAGPIVGDFQL